MTRPLTCADRTPEPGDHITGVPLAEWSTRGTDKTFEVWDIDHRQVGLGYPGSQDGFKVPLRWVLASGRYIYRRDGGSVEVQGSTDSEAVK